MLWILRSGKLAWKSSPTSSLKVTGRRPAIAGGGRPAAGQVLTWCRSAVIRPGTQSYVVPPCCWLQLCMLHGEGHGGGILIGLFNLP